MQNYFKIEYTEEGCLKLLENTEDKFHMNWSRGEALWGSTKMPEGISVKRAHAFTEKGTLKESFFFQNTSEFPIYFKETDLGIFLSLPDSYTNAEECMKSHCHTHLWCGKEASWLMALRMSGTAPHLGLVLRKGSLKSYSIVRDESKLSNDRGSFLIHPEVAVLLPGEELEITWELFWFSDREDFFCKLLEYEDFPFIAAKRCTYFTGEEAEFTIWKKEKPEEVQICCDKSHIFWDMENQDGLYKIQVRIPVNAPGEYQIEITVDGIHTQAMLLGQISLEELTEKRCRFIAEKQQETEGHLKGAYLIYDNETEKRYYAHMPDDHNGGRERVAMGALIALWLQGHRDKALEKSITEYIAYVYRELFDKNTGDVYNDICRNNDWDRLYNYPWIAVFFMEVYKWKGELSYLLDGYRVMLRYYEKGGTDFYAIGIPTTEMISLLEKENCKEEAEELKRWALCHGEKVKKTGVHYPKSEVNYEQSIVAPAVSILLQAYELSKEESFLEAAKEQMEVLRLFHGMQPDYHLFENAIRHWDGYWFGKRRKLGDTFPHYWSVMSGVAYERMSRLTGEEKYANLASESFRGSLCLFFRDGSASCAMVYPQSINGGSGFYYDPWANDQDWALYYSWKFREIIWRKEKK